MNLRKLERRVVVGTRYMTLAAVVGSLGGSLLMFVLGLINIVNAFQVAFQTPPAPDSDAGSEASVVESLSVISVIEGLDRFLIAIVLLYFSYGVYSLFIRPEQRERELSLPEWLRVKQIGQLKQVVAEVIIVILFVLFLRVALQVFQDPGVSLSWPQMGAIVLLPVCTLLLGLSLRLVQLHPKPQRPSLQEATGEEEHDDEGDAES